MAAIEPNWQALLVFLIAWLAACIGFIYLSGNLPIKAAPAAVQSSVGSTLIWINLVMLIALAVMTVTFAINALRWTSIVVGGGFVFLFAPFVVQDLPSGLKDTPIGLAALLLCIVLASGLIYAAGF